MRTVFISDRAEEVSRVRQQLQAAAQLVTVGALRREANVDVADWAIIGTPDQALEQIAHYRARIGMTHLIATRLRVPGVEGTLLRRSLVLLAGLRKQLS